MISEVEVVSREAPFPGSLTGFLSLEKKCLPYQEGVLKEVCQEGGWEGEAAKRA